jgi:hypothetical protein
VVHFEGVVEQVSIAILVLPLVVWNSIVDLHWRLHVRDPDMAGCMANTDAGDTRSKVLDFVLRRDLVRSRVMTDRQTRRVQGIFVVTPRTLRTAQRVFS